MINNILNECVAYFKNNKGYRRFFEALHKKYLSLGKMGGTVVISKLSNEERTALSGLLRKDYSRQDSVTIKVSDFQKALESTRFNACGIEEILEAYFEEELVSNSEKRQNYLSEREEYFKSLLDKYSGTGAFGWLKNTLLEQSFGYHTIIKRYNINSKQLKQELGFVCDAINNLPVLNNNYIRLPVFAAKITADPHTFDDGTSCGELFMIALSNFFMVSRSQSNLERAELLYKAGLLIDDVSNKVLCSGLVAYDRNGSHSGWEGFYLRNEALFVTLTNLSKLIKVDSPYKVAFVVENPSAFMAIRDNSNENIPIICGNGQLNMAALALLDLLVKNDVKIYYSGDFDPEGLLIADKLKIRYENNLVLWRYTEADYKKCLSKKAASQRRIKQLNHIQSEELLEIADLLKVNGLCGYQEQLINDLTMDIKSIMTSGF